MIDETWFIFFIGFIVGSIFWIAVGYIIALHQIEKEDKE
jgi:hypothetical protein